MVTFMTAIAAAKPSPALQQCMSGGAFKAALEQAKSANNTVAGGLVVAGFGVIVTNPYMVGIGIGTALAGGINGRKPIEEMKALCGQDSIAAAQHPADSGAKPADPYPAR